MLGLAGSRLLAEAKKRIKILAEEELNRAKEILTSKEPENERVSFTNLMIALNADESEIDHITFGKMCSGFQNPNCLAELLQLILNSQNDEVYAPSTYDKLFEEFLWFSKSLGFTSLRLCLGHTRIGIPGTLSAQPNESLTFKPIATSPAQSLESPPKKIKGEKVTGLWIGDERTLYNILKIYFRNQGAQRKVYFSLFSEQFTHANSVFRGLNIFQIGQTLIDATVGLSHQEKGADSLRNLLRCQLFQDMFTRINNSSIKALFHRETISVNPELNESKTHGLFQRYRKLVDQYNPRATKVRSKRKIIPDELIADYCLILLLTEKIFGRINFTELYKASHVKDVIRTGIRLMIVDGLIVEFKKIVVKQLFVCGTRRFNIYKFFPKFISVIASIGDLELLIYLEAEFQGFTAPLRENVRSDQKDPSGPMPNYELRHDILSNEDNDSGIFSLGPGNKFDDIVYFGSHLNPNLVNEMFASAMFSSVVNCELGISEYLLQKDLAERKLTSEVAKRFISNVAQFCNRSKLNKLQKDSIGEFLQKILSGLNL